MEPSNFSSVRGPSNQTSRQSSLKRSFSQQDESLKGHNENQNPNIVNETSSKTLQPPGLFIDTGGGGLSVQIDSPSPISTPVMSSFAGSPCRAQLISPKHKEEGGSQTYSWYELDANKYLIVTEKELGKGSQGNVRYGYLKDENGLTKVAIKSVKSFSDYQNSLEIEDRLPESNTLLTNIDKFKVSQKGEDYGVYRAMVSNLEDQDSVTDLFYNSWGKFKQQIRRLFDGISIMHKSDVVHRDLTPDNLFKDREGNVVIGDLGFAKPYTTHQVPIKTKKWIFEQFKIESSKDPANSTDGEQSISGSDILISLGPSHSKDDETVFLAISIMKMLFNYNHSISLCDESLDDLIDYITGEKQFETPPERYNEQVGKRVEIFRERHGQASLNEFLGFIKEVLNSNPPMSSDALLREWDLRFPDEGLPEISRNPSNIEDVSLENTLADIASHQTRNLTEF